MRAGLVGLPVGMRPGPVSFTAHYELGARLNGENFRSAIQSGTLLVGHHVNLQGTFRRSSCRTYARWTGSHPHSTTCGAHQSRQSVGPSAHDGSLWTAVRRFPPIASTNTTTAGPARRRRAICKTRSLRKAFVAVVWAAGAGCASHRTRAKSCSHAPRMTSFCAEFPARNPSANDKASS